MCPPNKDVTGGAILEIMPPREWCMAKAQFAVLFGERFTRAMA
jgi:hypothetical protein